MIHFIILGLIAFSMIAAIIEWVFREREALFLLVCGVVPYALHHPPIDLALPIAILIPFVLTMMALGSAWWRDRSHGLKLFLFSTPFFLLYGLLAIFSIYF